MGDWGGGNGALPGTGPRGSSAEVFQAFARFRERHTTPGDQGGKGSASVAAEQQQQQRASYWWDSAALQTEAAAAAALAGTGDGAGTGLEASDAGEGAPVPTSRDALEEVERRFALAQAFALRMVVTGGLRKSGGAAATFRDLS